MRILILGDVLVHDVRGLATLTRCRILRDTKSYQYTEEPLTCLICIAGESR